MSVPKKRMPAPERREYILEKAAEVFARKGYRLASVSDIVESAGIGRGTFYLYFQSKKDIFGELIEVFFSGFEAQLEENHAYLEAAFKGGNILGTWRDNMLRILEYHKKNPDLTAIVYREAIGSDEDFSAKMEQMSGIARKILEEEFRMMRKRGMVREMDVGVITTMVMGSSINVIMEQLSKGGLTDLERMADTIVEYHIRALIPDEGSVARAVNSAHAGGVARATI
jgi:AcrR family transcriptional regulator